MLAANSVGDLASSYNADVFLAEVIDQYENEIRWFGLERRRSK